MQPFKQLNSVKMRPDMPGCHSEKQFFVLRCPVRFEMTKYALLVPRRLKVSLTGKRNLVVWLRTAAIAILLFFRMPLDREPNEAVNQIRVSESGGRPQLGIHADGRESGHSIDFIDVNLFALRVHEEVYARQAGAFHGAKGGDGQLLH